MRLFVQEEDGAGFRVFRIYNEKEFFEGEPQSIVDDVEVPDENVEEWKALRYKLGDLLEEATDSSERKEHLEKIARVKNRLEELQK
jgi:hypothetical protein